jgi:uncharacterized SAM-binding protein YcdF (DUF218 family)
MKRTQPALPRRAWYLATGIGAWTGALVLTWLRIQRMRHPGDVGAVDAIVVLGAAVRADRTPCPELVRRLDEAAALREQGHAETILCCGGHSPLGHSEASAMREALLLRGIPPHAVLIDESSSSTRRAVAAVRRRGHGHWRRVVFVSSGYHLYRILREAERQTVDAVVWAPGAGTQSNRRRVNLPGFRQWAREIAAVWWYAASAPLQSDRAATARLQPPERLGDYHRITDADPIEELDEVVVRQLHAAAR